MLQCSNISVSCQKIAEYPEALKNIFVVALLLFIIKLSRHLIIFLFPPGGGHLKFSSICLQVDSSSK